MSTRILYWNIQQFSLNKLNENVTLLGEKRKQTEKKGITRGMSRLQHIMKDVIAPVNPDLFVIVEVQAGGNKGDQDGLPIHGSDARKATFILLKELRKQNANWSLIPPVNVGGFNPTPNSEGLFKGLREGVAVYYRSDKLQFEGPYVMSKFKSLEKREGEAPIIHTQTNARSNSPNQEGVLKELSGYPSDWNGAFCEDAKKRQIPIFDPEKKEAVQVYENQLAGQYVYYPWPDTEAVPKPPLPLPQQFFPKKRDTRTPPAENRIDFPERYDRPPYLTCFREIAPDSKKRIIKLFSIHTSPSRAAKAVEKYKHVPELQTIENNEVSVVLGDFNVDTFANPPNKAPFNVLTNATDTDGGLGYKIKIDSIPPDSGDSQVDEDRRPYCMTHIFPTDHATPNNNEDETDATHNVYPRYGYMGAKYKNPATQTWFFGNRGAIDNVFLRYGNERNKPDDHKLTIVNTIVGKPYNKLANPPQNVGADLTGGLDIPKTISNKSLPLPRRNSQGGFDNATQEELTAFREWNNYGKVRSTSDHLAISVDV